MRILLALVLLRFAAGEECPIIDWLKEHGADVLDTVKECKDVPAIIKRVQNSECKAKSGPVDKVAIGLWYAITGLEHMNGTLPDQVKHSEIIAKVKSFATKTAMAAVHKGVSTFCEHHECKEQAAQLQATVGTCYAALTCNFMGKVLPYAECKVKLQNYIENSMQIVMPGMCVKEDLNAGKMYYCRELDADLVFKHVDCYAEIKLPHVAKGGAKCTPKCVQLWQDVKAKTPTCSAFSDEMTQKNYANILALLQDIAKDSKIPMEKMIDNMPKSVPSYSDACGQGTQSVLV